jgi:bifunctional non-homologous end joining protein LigD
MKPATTLTHFVVQEHHARARHFDFRLEKDGVLRSWAVPKGPPVAAAERHLALEVEDHPLESGAFQGVIQSGRYGAGTVRIWDRGECEIREWTEHRIVFVLHGQWLRGCFGLIRLPGVGPRHWLFLRMQRRLAAAGVSPS